MAAHAVRCTACRSAIPTDLLAAVGDICPRCHRPLNPSGRKHDRAVAQTLDWADEAASRGDHAEALAWLSMLDTMGHQFSNEYQRKRQKWRAALRNRSTRDDLNARAITTGEP